MLASSIPTKFPFPFANSAGPSFIRPVPVASQIGINPGAASDTDGFVPLNFLVPSAGGIPPDGRDINGILNQTTAWNLWQSIGGPVFYDATQSTAIGGYPHGTLLNAVGITAGYWWSEVDNNTSDPDTGGANWLFIQMINPATTPIGTENIVEFTGAGTHSYTPTTGARALLIRIQAPGGGGGAAAAPSSGSLSSGQAGSGGSYAEKDVLTSALTFPATLTIGSAGVGGVGGNGTNGGTTSFVCTGMTSVVCGGGLGGFGNTTFSSFPVFPAANSGGTATGGDVNIAGGVAQSATLLSATVANQGQSGGAVLGQPALQFGISSNGQTGSGFGSGGTGGLSYASAGTHNGGAGAPSIIIVSELF